MKRWRVLSTVILVLLCMVMLCNSAFAYSTVRSGSSGSDVKTLQTMLNTVDSAGLSVDGLFGTATFKAVKSYQSSRGLSADGICGPKTWEKLTAEYKEITGTVSDSYPTLRNGSKGTNVKNLQKMLNEVTNAGLDIDGVYGPTTLQAVKNYQNIVGLSVDGVCGPKTWAKLTNDYDDGKSYDTSRITIGSGNYDPVELMVGRTYSISGKISSVNKLTKVTIGIYNADGSATSSVKTVSPNSPTYNIKGVDSYIKFGQLEGSEEGTNYYFKVTATDSTGTSEELVNNHFVVKRLNTTYTWPLPGKTYISSNFGWRTHYTGGKQYHSGVDIPASGGTNVLAAEDGIAYIRCDTCRHNYGKKSKEQYLKECGCGGGYGNWVIIVHYDGMRTIYAHLKEVLITDNSQVSKGMPIGTVGSTGLSSDNHLHFEMRSGVSTDTRVNPLDYVNPQ